MTQRVIAGPKAPGILTNILHIGNVWIKSNSNFKNDIRSYIVGTININSIN